MTLRELIEKGKVRLTVNDFDCENEAEKLIDKGWLKKEINIAQSRKFYKKVCKEMIGKIEDDTFSFNSKYFFEDIKEIIKNLKYMQKYDDGTRYLVIEKEM